MKFGSRRMIPATAGALMAWLVGVAFTGSGSATSTSSSVASSNQSIEKSGDGAVLPLSTFQSIEKSGDGAVLPLCGSAAFASPSIQGGAGDKPLMSEEVFENIQVLDGIPVDEFMATMSIFSSSLGMCCNECHAGGQDWVTDVAPKRTARVMVEMTDNINQDFFGGRRVVTCWSCHRSGYPPPVVPSLDLMYGPPPQSRWDDELREQQPRFTPPDEIFDKYIQATGGAGPVAKLTSFVAKGTMGGYGGGQQGTFEVFAQAPNQRSLVVHWLDGDRTLTYDGRAGWEASPITAVPVLTYTRGELDRVRLDAELSFPGGIKEVLTDWRSQLGLIEDRAAPRVQGTSASGSYANLFFDQQSGLLSRVVFYTSTRVGDNPTEIDYGDYREAAGVMIPFRWTARWTGGWDTYQITDLQPNVQIDPAQFARPDPVEGRPGSRIPL